MLHQGLGLAVAGAADGAGERGFHLVATLTLLLQQHQDGLQHVQGLETGDDDGLAVALGDGLEGCTADDGRHVAGADEAINGYRGRPLEDGLHGGGREHVVTQHREVAQPLRLCLQHRDRRGRGGGFEANGQEHHLLLGVFTGQGQGLQRRGDQAHMRAEGLGLAQAQPVGGGHAQHVAIAADRDAGLPGQGNGLIDPADGQHTDRTTGAMDQRQPVGQQVLQAVARQGVRVAAAKLHQTHGAIEWHGLGNGVCQPLGQGAVPEGVQGVVRGSGFDHVRASCCSCCNSARVAWASASSMTCRAKPTWTMT